ncbi:MAG: hypothetical protein ACE368_02040 [Paracoccaceae bacterium]
MKFVSVETNDGLIQSLYAQGWLPALALVLAAILILVLAWWRIVHARSSRHGCRWVQDKAHFSQATSRWICATCGNPGFSRDTGAPRQCSQALNARVL